MVVMLPSSFEGHDFDAVDLDAFDLSFELQHHALVATPLVYLI